MSERAPGFEEYSPSRLEWFAVLLNSLIQFKNTQIDTVFIPENDGKTILLYMRYKKDINSQVLEKHTENAKILAQDMAKRYGWDSWVEINVHQEHY